MCKPVDNGYQTAIAHTKGKLITYYISSSSMWDIGWPALLQLKLYAERNSLPPSTLILKDTYSAKAYSEESLKILLQKDSHRIRNIIICTAFFVVVALLLILGLMLFVFFRSKSHKESDWVKKIDEKLPTVLALTVLSAIAIFYIIALTSAAIQYWRQVHNDSDVLYDFDVLRNLGPLIIAIIFDCLCMIAWIAIVIVAGLSYWQCKACKCLDQKYTLVILSLTVLCPFFCIITHSPYIAIAYLNDGDHASSIFIYYTVLCYIFFGITWLFFHWCQTYSKDQNNKIDTADQQEVCRKEVTGGAKKTRVALGSEEQSGKPPHVSKITKDLKSAADDITEVHKKAPAISEGKKEVTVVDIDGLATCVVPDSEDQPPAGNHEQQGQPQTGNGEQQGQPQTGNGEQRGQLQTANGKQQGQPQTNEPQKSSCACCTSCFDRISAKTSVCCVEHFRSLSMIFLGFTIFFLFGLVVVIACYFVIIPINKAISDAPMRLLSIYQSGGFLIGSFIVYKVLDYFYSKGKDKNMDKDKKQDAEKE